MTQFNVPGYPESQRSSTIAAVAECTPDGTELFASVMAAGFTKTNRVITFQGRCGA